MQHYVNELALLAIGNKNCLDKTWPIVDYTSDRSWTLDIADIAYNYESTYKDDPEIIYWYKLETDDKYEFSMLNRGIMYTYPM